jgi:hypothetical protein
MKLVCFLVLITTSCITQADVFKCADKSGKTLYQDSPCTGNEKGRELDIKTDPKLDAEAKSKYDALQAERAVKDRLKIQTNENAARQAEQIQNQDSDAAAAAQHQQAIDKEKQDERVRLYNRLLF